MGPATGMDPTNPKAKPMAAAMSIYWPLKGAQSLHSRKLLRALRATLSLYQSFSCIAVDSSMVFGPLPPSPGAGGGQHGRLAHRPRAAGEHALLYESPSASFAAWARRSAARLRR